MSSASVPTPLALEPPSTAAPVAAVEIHAHGSAGKSRRSLHIPALDGIRGLAILLVLVFHFGDVGNGSKSLNVEGLISRAIGAGWVGVDLFFVLSGFLITSILCEAVGTAGYFKNFYMRRALRIFPLYFGTLIVAFVVVPLIWGRPKGYDAVYKDWWVLVLYLQNFVPINWQSFSHFWSLAVEEHFYMVWPAVLFFFGRRGAIVACLLMIATAIGIRMYRVYELPSNFVNLQQTYLWTICRMDSLAIGSLLALSVNGVATQLSRYARIAPWVLAGAVALSVGIFLKHGSFSYQVSTVQAVGYTTVALGAAALLVMTINSKPDQLLGWIFTTNWLRFFGKYSYGIYVVHSFVHHALKHEFPLKRIQEITGVSYWVSYGLYAIAATLLSIGLALLSWHLYEKHFLKLKKFFEYRAPTLEGFKPNEPVAAKA